MPIAYFLCPYHRRPSTPQRPIRFCAMDAHTPELEATGGAWAESEIVDNQAVVRVRASATQLASLALRFPTLSETEAERAIKAGRREVRSEVETDRIVPTPTTLPSKPLALLIREVSEVKPSTEFTTLLGLWAAVGFGLGWRLPWHEVIRGALSGYPPLWGGAFPTTGVLDDFNRADQGPPPSANWSQSWLGNGWKVISNQAGVNVDAANNGDYWNVSPYGPDTEVLVTLASIPSTGWFRYAELQARLAQPTSSATVDGYALALFGDSVGVPRLHAKYRIDNGAYTQLGATVTQDVASGASIGLELVGSTIQEYFRPPGGSWSALGAPVTDGTYTAAGFLGMASNSSVLRVDDFGGGTIGGGGWTGPPPRHPMAHLIVR